MANTTTQKWYDRNALIILLFFILPPLGIYGMAKRNSAAWKKALYIVPAALWMIFTIIVLLVTLFVDTYKTGIMYYNQKDYVNAYRTFKRVQPDHPGYADAVAKIKELEPIVDSMETVKKKKREEARLKEEADRQSMAKETGRQNTKPESILPQAQQDFIKIIADAEKEYKAAPNELKKSAVRSKRGELIKMALGNKREFHEWTGVVTTMETTSKGNAYFGIKIEGTDIGIMTTNNELSNIFDNTLISQSDPLYNIIAELKTGDKVRVSGIFMTSDNTDFISEISLTEKGSMTDPDFIAKFTKVVKL